MAVELLILPPRGESGIRIVGDAISAAVYKLVDDAIACCPEAADERETFYLDVLYAIQDLGYVPESIQITPSVKA